MSLKQSIINLTRKLLPRPIRYGEMQPPKSELQDHYMYRNGAYVGYVKADEYRIEKGACVLLVNGCRIGLIRDVDQVAVR